jgi:hypothetical protein
VASKEIFSGALQLLRWSETSNQGATVTFQLADPADLERFKDLTMAKKGMAGQIIAAIMKTVDDEEEVANDSQPDPDPEPEKLKGGELAKLAGMWCESPLFRRWLVVHGGFKDLRSSEDAAEVIRSWCVVDSRAQLDHDDEAATRFQKFIRGPYMAWQQGRHK